MSIQCVFHSHHCLDTRRSKCIWLISFFHIYFTVLLRTVLNCCDQTSPVNGFCEHLNCKMSENVNKSRKGALVTQRVLIEFKNLIQTKRFWKAKWILWWRQWIQYEKNISKFSLSIENSSLSIIHTKNDHCCRLCIWV